MSLFEELTEIELHSKETAKKTTKKAYHDCHKEQNKLYHTTEKATRLRRWLEHVSKRKAELMGS